MRASPTRLWTFYSDFEKFKSKYVDKIPQETTDNMRIGTAVDDVLTYGVKEFFKKYEITPWKKRRDKEKMDKQLTSGMASITFQAVLAYVANPKMDISNARYKKQAEKTTYIDGIECYCIADRYMLEENIIRDYKTTGCRGSQPMDFHNTAEQWGYYFKMAFYNMIFGGNNHCVLDFYHKTDKITYSLYITPDIMEENTRKVKEALVLFKQFLTDNNHV